MGRCSKVKPALTLFATGFIQVLLVSVNTWQISHFKWIGAFLVAYLISLVWTFNVKGVAFGGWIERLVYPLGAAMGCMVGMLICKALY